MEFALFLALTQLNDCYIDSVKAEYNQNLKQITLTLEPNITAYCDFPDEVLVEIEFHDNITMVQYVEQFYAFNTTRSIVMTGVEIVDSVTSLAVEPRAAYLQISSLYSTFSIQIAQFSYQTSQFDACFDNSKSVFNPTFGSYSFSVYLTTACERQITGAQSYQLTYGYEARNVAASGNCNFDAPSRIFTCTEGVNYYKYIQIPFTTARVVFYIEIAGIQYTSELIFENIQLGQVSRLFESYTLIVFYNNILITAVIDQTGYSQLMSLINQESDTIIYRISCRDRKTGTVFAMSLTNEKYKQDRSAYSFVCEDSACLRSLGEIAQGAADYDFYLDITTLKQTMLDAFFGMKLQHTDSCIDKSIVLVVSDVELCLFVYMKNSASCRANKKYTQISTYIINPMVYDVVLAQFKVHHDFVEPYYCFTCDGPCPGLGDPDCGIMVEFQQDGKSRSVGYVVSHANFNYYTMTIVTSVIGSAAIAGFLVDDIIKIVYFRRLVKEYRAKKHAK